MCERAENTLPAFKHAISKGMNFLEIDLVLTRDKQIVCCHDVDLERLCGSEYSGMGVEDYNYADLPLLQRTIMKDTMDTLP